MDYKIYKAGNLRGDKIKYKDGIGCCIWTPFKKDTEEGCPTSEDIEEPGLCFDFSANELENLKNLSEQLINATADEYIPDEEHEKFETEMKIKQSKLWYKIYDKLCDIGFSFHPFDWKRPCISVSRPIIRKHFLGFLLCNGIKIGPITITW